MHIEVLNNSSLLKRQPYFNAVLSGASSEQLFPSHSILLKPTKPLARSLLKSLCIYTNCSNTLFNQTTERRTRITIDLPSKKTRMMSNSQETAITINESKSGKKGNTAAVIIDKSSSGKKVKSSYEKITSTTKALPNPHARFKKGLAVFDLIFRLGAVAAALGATVVMGNVDQILPFFTQFFQFEAAYDDLPAFQFFVIANGFATGYLVLSLIISIVCIARPMSVGPKLFLFIMDTLVLALITAATGAATSMVYLAHNGNESSNWNAICQQFTDFCEQSSGAVVSAFVAAVMVVFLIVLSAFALRRH